MVVVVVVVVVVVEVEVEVVVVVVVGMGVQGEAALAVVLAWGCGINNSSCRSGRVAIRCCAVPLAICLGRPSITQWTVTQPPVVLVVVARFPSKS